jgi:hypothetical protein
VSAPPIPRPLPKLDGDAARYWRALAEGRIELPRCRACGRWIFYPRPFCPACHETDPEWHEVPGAGRVYTFSVVHRATHPFFLRRTPYVYAVVELGIGVRLPTTLLVDEPAEARIGMEVEPVFATVDDGVTLLHFRPARR